MKEIDELNRAIAALETQRFTLGDRVVDAALTTLREKLASLEQYTHASRQRRLVTMLFLDIVSSTELSQGLEPEEVQEMMGGALKRLAAQVEIYGGQVIQFMGDGFVAAFGLKLTQENDARQAVRAGLAILADVPACAEALEQRFGKPGFNVRIGLHTGRVVPGTFSKAESPVMGLTVSMASRIEEAAKSGSLFISQFTFQHVRGAFDVLLQDPITAKGFPKPVTVYQVLAARPRTFRTFTRGVQGVESRLVGRETEVHQLQTTFTQVIASGQAHLITILGEAGIGKSRLLYEFDRWVANHPTQVAAFKARASPQSMSVPFSLLRAMISYHLKLLTTDQLDVTRQRLEQALSDTRIDDPQMKAHFIGSLLGFDFSGSPYLQGVRSDPQQLNQRGQLYLSQFLAGVTTLSPTIIMLDDLHWADSPSLGFLNQFLHHYPHIRLLVVCLGRPPLVERFPGWGQATPDKMLPTPGSVGIPLSQQIDLEPLTRQSSQELIDDILRNVENLPDQLSQQILDRSEGNPFYIEEFIQALLDARIIQPGPQAGRWNVDPSHLGQMELPDTLVALLEARLDNLSQSERTLLQQAAVIGQVFWHSALQSVHGDMPITSEQLQLLTRRGFIYPQGTSTFAGTDEYRFHHVLLRDVAYHALMKPDRKIYHAQVANWLIQVTQVSGRVGEFAPIIADHYQHAGNRNLAADWFTQSGTQARNQGAFIQARTFFDRALELLPSQTEAPSSSSDLECRWRALSGRDEVVGILGDTSARLADDVALVELAQHLGDDHLLAEAWFRRGFYLGMNAQYPQERLAYDLALAAAERAPDLPRQLLILGLKVICELRLGDFESAARGAISAQALAPKVTDDLALARCLTNLSTYYTETGDIGQAAQLLEQQLAIFQHTGNIQDEVVGLSNLGYAYIQLGLPEQGITALQTCIERAQAIGHRKICAYGGLNLALAHWRHGDANAALLQLQHCLPELESMSDAFGHAVGTTYASLAQEQLGHLMQALAGFEQATKTLGSIGALGYLNDAQAGIARCLLGLNHIEDAFQAALDLWGYLRKQAGTGMEFPILAHETCADIFAAQGAHALARRAIQAGYGELILRAGRISHPGWRRSFLEQIPEHHRIQLSWQKYIQPSQV